LLGDRTETRPAGDVADTGSPNSAVGRAKREWVIATLLNRPVKFLVRDADGISALDTGAVKNESAARSDSRGANSR
jgi:hypothetical protein